MKREHIQPDCRVKLVSSAEVGVLIINIVQGGLRGYNSEALLRSMTTCSPNTPIYRSIPAVQ